MILASSVWLQAYTWGYNTYGSLGIGAGHGQSYSEPQRITGF